MPKFIKWSFIISGLLMGCAHSVMRGSVAMKVSDDTAHVCLGDKEVKVGDRVAIFQNNCPTDPGSYYRAHKTPMCQKVRVGEGLVTEVLNEHYSVVKFDPNVKFAENSIVEKIK